jgi:putative ribosome biogenesis GTPase RsgA
VTVLYDRDAERASVDALIDGARSSRSGVLVVRGEAGIGKSSLLGHAVAQLDGFAGRVSDSGEGRWTVS